MEKIYYSTYRENFEFRSGVGERWTAAEIIDEYESRSASFPELVGMFNTYEEAREAVMDYFGNPMSCTFEERGSIGMLIKGTLYYIAEELYDVNDGDHEYDQELSREYFVTAL